MKHQVKSRCNTDFKITQVAQGLKVHAHLIEHVSLCGHLVKNMNLSNITFTTVMCQKIYSPIIKKIASLFTTMIGPQDTSKYPNGKFLISKM